ncbi:hypothetical protein ACLOJK_028041, partial [Asimina triloba]
GTDSVILRDKLHETIPFYLSAKLLMLWRSNDTRAQRSTYAQRDSKFQEYVNVAQHTLSDFSGLGWVGLNGIACGPGYQPSGGARVSMLVEDYRLDKRSGPFNRKDDRS